MNEFQLINYLAKKIQIKNPQVIKGIGDDCAVLSYSLNQYFLYTTDSLVENVHFKLNWLNHSEQLYYLLGWKSLAVNISDIYAMGGTPKFALVSLHIPLKIKDHDLKTFYYGINECAKRYKISLVGGNIAKSNHDFIITVSLLGVVNKNHLLLRSGACVNDYIYVQKGIGESSAGLSLLNKHYSKMNALILSHVKPQPHIHWKKLQSQYTISSAIDISDGLIGDLNHILEESKVGAEIDMNKIPVSKELKKVFPHHYFYYLLYGGEDYSILFTSKNFIQEKDIFCIGKIIKDKHLCLIKNNKKWKLKRIKGFMHR